MLSSLDALAEKISPGSGKNSPNQQQQSPQGAESVGTATTPGNTSGSIASTKTHFSQSIHPYQKIDHINNNREKWVDHILIYKLCFYVSKELQSIIIMENSAKMKLQFLLLEKTRKFTALHIDTRKKSCLLSPLAHTSESIVRRINLNCIVPNDDGVIRRCRCRVRKHQPTETKISGRTNFSFHNKIINVHKTGI